MIDLVVRKARIGFYNRLICHLNKFTVGAKFSSLFFKVEIPHDTLIRLPHFYCITINPKSVIGKNVTIYNCVTIGYNPIGKNRGVPIIEDDVIIYSNCVITGNITVSKGAIIGAGSVVVTNIPENAIACGNPAKVVRLQD